MEVQRLKVRFTSGSRGSQQGGLKLETSGGLNCSNGLYHEDPFFYSLASVEVMYLDLD